MPTHSGGQPRIHANPVARAKAHDDALRAAGGRKVLARLPAASVAHLETLRARGAPSDTAAIIAALAVAVGE